MRVKSVLLAIGFLIAVPVGAYAQASLSGGGNVEKGRASSPLPPSALVQASNYLNARLSGRTPAILSNCLLGVVLGMSEEASANVRR